MKRKIYKDLLNWKENSINIPLMIIGVRSTKNFGFENNIKSIPLYAAFLIK